MEEPNYYEVLQVSPDASFDDLSRAYHQRMADVPGGWKIFDEPAASIRKAYYTLSSESDRRAYDISIGLVPYYLGNLPGTCPVPADQMIKIDSHDVRVSYQTVGFGTVITASARLTLRAYQALGDRCPVRLLNVNHIVVTDDEGSRLFSSPGWRLLSYEHSIWLREQRRRVLVTRAASCEQRCDDMTAQGLPTGEIQELVAALILRIEREEYAHRSNYDGILSQCTHIERKLEQLASPTENIWVEGLLNGSIDHRHLPHNRGVVRCLEQLSIRSGGFFEPITEPMLRSFYEQRTTGVRTMSELQELELRLDGQDYAPDELVNDDSLELAPTAVSFDGNRGDSLYPVSYCVKQIDGQQVAVAMVQLPVRVYQRNAPEYGRASRFPVLPHGIVWFCEILQGGQLLANGLVSVELSRKLDKALKAKARGKHADSDGGLNGYEPATEVPPWYAGASKPGRRR